MSHNSQQPPTKEQIARLAYEMYLHRGSKNGCALDDWLAAEKKLSKQYSSSTKKTRTVAAHQGRQSPLVFATDSKHDSPAHHDRIDPCREFPIQASKKLDDAHNDTVRRNW